MTKELCWGFLWIFVFVHLLAGVALSLGDSLTMVRTARDRLRTVVVLVLFGAFPAVWIPMVRESGVFIVRLIKNE